MRAADLLTEVDWSARYPAADALRRHPGKWVHFSNVPKIGIHPSRTHHDPPGVYLYPSRWLMNNYGGFQYGITYPYYFIVTFEQRNGVDLGRMRNEKASSIAKRNGWDEWWEKIRNEPQIYFNGVHRPMDRKLFRKPGGAFYGICDYLANTQGISWLKLLKGLDYLIDPGHGIIAQDEPAQACILNPRIINIVEFGQNADSYVRAYGKAVERLAAEFGGQFYWRQKLPRLKAIIEGKPIEVTVDGGNLRMFLSYFHQNGYHYTEEIRLPFETGDLADTTSHLRYEINRALRNAQSDGIELPWGYGRIRQIVMLMSHQARPNLHSKPIDTGVQYWAFFNNVVRVDVQFIAQSEGLGAEVGMSVKIDDHHVAPRFGDQFDNRDSPEEVAKRLLDGLAHEVKKQSAIEPYRLGKGSRLQFGDRLEPSDENSSG